MAKLTQKNTPERRIKPIQTDLDAGINESTEDGFADRSGDPVQPAAIPQPKIKLPVHAKGAQVIDAQSRVVALCGAYGNTPWDTRAEMARIIADALNATQN